jgi:hypothetical protein
MSCLFAEAGPDVDEVIHAIGLVFLKVVGKHRLGFHLFTVQVKGDTFVEKRHALFEFLAFAVDRSQPGVETRLIAFNRLTDLRAEVLNGCKKGFHIRLKGFDDRGFIA